MMNKRATIFLCAVLLLQAIPSQSAAGTWEDQYLSHSKRIILAGWLTFASAYILGLAVGDPLINVADPCPAGDDSCAMSHGIASGIMAIPLAGPATVAGALFRDAEGGGIGLALFLLIDSLAQIAGLTVAIIGHVKYSKAKKKIGIAATSPPGYPYDRHGIAAAPFVASGGGGIAVSGFF